MSNFKSPFWITVLYIIPIGSIIELCLFGGHPYWYNIIAMLGVIFPIACWLGRAAAYVFNDDDNPTCPKHPKCTCGIDNNLGEV